MELTAREIAAITGGALVQGPPDAVARSFAIDSRVLDAGACFVALVDARDGNDFVEAAFVAGATVAVVSRDVTVAPDSGAIVRVADGYEALARLGAAARDRLRPAAVVGITGSAGKTGTKDLTAGALGRKFGVHASPGNFNNEAGLPLSLLHAPARVEVLVLEMGARAPGNIADLCVIARPTVGVVTNIGLAHAGLLGGVEGIARVKGELLESLPADGFAVLDAADDTAHRLGLRTPARVVLVAVGDQPERRGAEVVADAIELDAELRPSFVLDTAWGQAHVQLEVRGVHQVANAAQAAAVALCLGVPLDDVVSGLAAVGPARWRMQVERAASGAFVVHDAYNASPAAVAAALRALAAVPGVQRRIAVLGQMLELGDATEREHVALGTLAADLGVDVLVTVGDGARPLARAARGADAPVALVLETADAAGACTAVRGLAIGERDAVLVKGSRAIGLERVADAIVTSTAEVAP